MKKQRGFNKKNSVTIAPGGAVYGRYDVLDTFYETQEKEKKQAEENTKQKAIEEQEAKERKIQEAIEEAQKHENEYEQRTKREKENLAIYQAYLVGSVLSI